MRQNPQQIRVVPIAPGKISQLNLAAKAQLSPEEYEDFIQLTAQLAIYGLTPWLNTQLGKYMAKLQWELEVEESPEWIAALIACDEKFLGRELKEMCYQYNLSDSGHKKILCRRLYEADVPEVVDVMQPFLGIAGVTEVSGKHLVATQGKEENMGIIRDFPPSGFIKAGIFNSRSGAYQFRRSILVPDGIYKEHNRTEDEVVVIPVEKHRLRYYEVWMRKF